MRGDGRTFFEINVVVGNVIQITRVYSVVGCLGHPPRPFSCPLNRVILINTFYFAVVRTDSPDNDSAFSDCVSLLSSSESSASSSGTTNHSAGKKVRVVVIR